MIDWPKRLAHEGPFYRRLFERARRPERGRRGLRHRPARGHVPLLGSARRRGRPQSGDDRPCPGQLSASRPDCVGWCAASTSRSRRPSPSMRPFAWAIRCRWRRTWRPSERAIGQMLAAVRRGGLLVVQALNLWRLARRAVRLAEVPAGHSAATRSPHRQGSSSLGRVRLRGTDRGRSRRRRLAANGMRAVHGVGSGRVGVDGPGCRGGPSTLLRRLSRRALRPSGERGLADGGDKVLPLCRSRTMKSRADAHIHRLGAANGKPSLMKYNRPSLANRPGP